MDRWILVASAALSAIGCASFSTVRSARVAPGSSLTLQASLASRPGEDAAWLWSYACEASCDHVIPSADVAYAYGRARGAMPYTIGGGINGTSAYLEGYAQLSSSTRLPFGIGGRLGIPLGGGWEHQIYGRADVPLSDQVRLLWNPGVFYHSSSSANSAGSFLGLVQGFGVELGAVTPSVAVVWGRAQRTTGGVESAETYRVFVTGALSVTLPQPRSRSGSDTRH